MYRLIIRPNVLRRARLRRLLTQKALAEKSGLSEWTILRLETGVTEEEPSIGVHPGTVEKLANALGVEPLELAEVVERMTI